MNRRAIFLDRDGVLNVNRGDYVKTWAEFVFLPKVLHSLQELAQIDILIVVITNQSAVNRGLMSQAILEQIHDHMVKEIEANGGRINAVYYCPHTPEDRCNCRKPNPGLLLKAAEDLGIDLKRSYCVGDKWSDLMAGQVVGCQGILVLTGEWKNEDSNSLDGFCIVNNLQEAVEFVNNTWIRS